MELGDDHIKKLFSSKLSNFEPDVPKLVWDNIESKLQETNTIVSEPKPAFKKNILKFSLWASSAAAIIIAILFLLPKNEIESSSSNTLISQYNQAEPIISNQKTERNTNDQLSSTDQKADSKLANKKNTIQPKKSVKTKPVLLAKQTVNQNIPDDNTLSISSITQRTEPKELSLTNKVSNNEKLPISLDESSFDELSKQIAAFEAEGSKQNELLPATTNLAENKNKESLQLGLTGGSSMTSTNEAKDNIRPAYGNLQTPSLRTLNAKTKHNQPVTFGITISKQLTNKLSIESGINYTYLSSELGAENESYKQKDMQYFHYLGIPLTLNYRFAQWNRFYFYSSLGGMIQKDFLGRRTSHSYISVSESGSSLKDKISQKNPQFSIHGGLGASYPLYNKLRVYSNIGAAYYIDANNEYATIYSDKKWLFNLNLGLRFEF